MHYSVFFSYFPLLLCITQMLHKHIFNLIIKKFWAFELQKSQGIPLHRISFVFVSEVFCLRNTILKVWNMSMSYSSSNIPKT